MENIDNRRQSLSDVMMMDKTKIVYDYDEEVFLYDNCKYKVLDFEELRDLFAEKFVETQEEIYHDNDMKLEETIMEDCLYAAQDILYYDIDEIYNEESVFNDYGYKLTSQELVDFIIESWGLEEAFGYFFGGDKNENLRKSILEDLARRRYSLYNETDVKNTVSIDGEMEYDERVGFGYYIFRTW